MHFSVSHDIKVVHSKHFWLIFGSFLASFSCVWQKNDQNDPKNDMKNDMKNGYREHPGKQNHTNEAKMHSTWSSAVLASTQHIQTPP